MLPLPQNRTSCVVAVAIPKPFGKYLVVVKYAHDFSVAHTATPYHAKWSLTASKAFVYLAATSGGIMADDKPKRKTHTSSMVKDRYNAKTYDRFLLTVPKGQKDIIKAHAESLGESLNAFITRAVNEATERDNTKE